MSITVNRLKNRLEPDPTRVIARLFNPGPERARVIIQRALGLPATQVAALLAQFEQRFGPRHKDLHAILDAHFEAVHGSVPTGVQLTEEQRHLVGAYFTMEYSLESAGLFNPSMVAARDQGGLPEGSTRFTMSLRATGEGHISSVVYRRGVIDKDCNIAIEDRSPYGVPLKRVESRSCDKERCRQSLIAAGALSEAAISVLGRLADPFDPGELHRALEDTRSELGRSAELEETQQNLLAVVHGNYDLELKDLKNLSETVIFPNSEIESGGIEDARLVRFVDDDGSIRYFGTYTAYNGFRIFPQLSEHSEDGVLRVRNLMGRGAQNKGMALFPRKVDGKYTMVSRFDSENLYLMQSDDVLFWDEARLLQVPKYYWEFVQIGNCGSPLETEEGWILLTHGVGPMRQYCIGAMLLDRDDPSRVIGQTEEPLLAPTDDESTGYVPNVVYSCGGMIHNGFVVIPYAMSDSVTSFATVDLGELLAELKR